MKCGVGAYTQRLVRALAEFEDIKITVLTDTRAIGATERNGVEVLAVIRGWQLIELIKIAKHVRRLSPDVVHIQYPSQGYFGKMPALIPLLIRFLGKRCVQTWHEPILGAGGLGLSCGLDALISVRQNLIASIPRLTQLALRNIPFSWIPAVSMLPMVTLRDDERSNIRHRYISDDEILLVYYGFVAPIKGIEVLLDIVAKTNVRLMMVCDLHMDDNYHRSLLERISTLGIWSRVTIMGFLPDEELSNILAVADAVVLPFRDGARSYNTTIDGAAAQGTFVLTTSFVHNGYEKDKNIYYAKPGDIDEMITSINKFAGFRSSCVQSTSKWLDIAGQHLDIYKQVVVA